MTRANKKIDNQFYIFIAGIIIFVIMAVMGWTKLQYGLNFTDEGYHMAESWRLAAGDHFLHDKSTGALSHYTLINSLIFKTCPDISLLQFRQIQFILTIVSLLIFSFALFRQSKQYVWLPFVLSLFAFTGLDTLGMISNLSYHNYPHLFMTLYLSFLLLGLNTKTTLLKCCFFILSSLCLWLMSLSLLPISFVLFSPLILFFFSRRFNSKYCSFSFRDLLYVLLPFVICWLVFISIFNKAYVINIINSLIASFSISYYTEELGYISWEVIPPILISTLFLSLFFVFFKKLSPLVSIIGCAILSAFVLLVINTSLFGYQPLHYIALSSKLLWFSALIISFSISFWIHIILKLLYKKEFNKEEILSIILMIPFTILSITMSIFSGLRALAWAHYAIPAVIAISCMMIAFIKKKKYKVQLSVLCLIFLLGPFYFTTARNDWNFTFYDVPPDLVNVKIETGFGRGIYTNKLYYSLYNWVIGTAKEYTQPGEYAISYIVFPMVHVITQLLPSLDESYITILKPPIFFKKAIDEMEKRGREPQIAFITDRIIALFPVSLEKRRFTFPGKDIDFPFSQDAISIYIRTHMTLASTFKVQDGFIIRCFVDKKRFSEKSLGVESGEDQILIH